MWTFKVKKNLSEKKQIYVRGKQSQFCLQSSYFDKISLEAFLSHSDIFIHSSYSTAVVHYELNALKLGQNQLLLFGVVALGCGTLVIILDISETKQL